MYQMSDIDTYVCAAKDCQNHGRGKRIGTRLLDDDGFSYCSVACMNQGPASAADLEAAQRYHDHAKELYDGSIVLLAKAQRAMISSKASAKRTFTLVIASVLFTIIYRR